MLFLTAVVLLLVWGLAVLSSQMMGGYVHVLLFASAAICATQLIRTRRRERA